MTPLECLGNMRKQFKPGKTIWAMLQSSDNFHMVMTASPAYPYLDKACQNRGSRPGMVGDFRGDVLALISEAIAIALNEGER